LFGKPSHPQQPSHPKKPSHHDPKADSAFKTKSKQGETSFDTTLKARRDEEAENKAYQEMKDEYSVRIELGLHDDKKHKVEEEGLPDTQKVLMMDKHIDLSKLNVYFVSQKDSIVGDVVYIKGKNQNMAFKNAITADGTLISLWAYKPTGEYANKYKKVFTLHYSEMSARTYIHNMKDLKKHPNNLHTILVPDIRNSETSSTIDAALSGIHEQDGKRTHTFTLNADKQAFFALMATPNLSFINRMLQEWPESLGHKEIKSITASITDKVHLRLGEGGGQWIYTAKVELGPIKK
jgi:hypothetical protein